MTEQFLSLPPQLKEFDKACVAKHLAIHGFPLKCEIFGLLRRRMSLQSVKTFQKHRYQKKSTGFVLSFQCQIEVVMLESVLKCVPFRTISQAVGFSRENDKDITCVAKTNK